MGNVEYNPVVVSLQSDISLTLGNSRWPGVERALKLSPRSNIRGQPQRIRTSPCYKSVQSKG